MGMSPITPSQNPGDPQRQSQVKFLYPFLHLPAMESRQIRVFCVIIRPWDQAGVPAPTLTTEDAGSRDQTGKLLISIPTTRPNILKVSLEKYGRPDPWWLCSIIVV